METFPKNHDVETTLQQGDIKGVKGNRDRAKKILVHLKSTFDTFSWPEHVVENLRKLKLKKDDFGMQTLRNKPLFDISKPLIPLDEAPALKSPVKAERKKVGRPIKRLSDGTCKKTENKTIDDIVDSIAETASFHKMNPFLILSMVSQRCQEKWKSSKVVSEDKYNMPDTEACAMMYNLNFSTHQYQELRLSLLKFGFALPQRNDIDSYKKTLLPEITSDTTKTACHIQSVVSNTISALLSACDWSDSSTTLFISSKFGFDGSGSHQIRHQKASIEDVPGYSSSNSVPGSEKRQPSTVSYVGAFWCPLMLRTKEKVVWENPLPNSTLFCRPVCLMRGKEDRENIEVHFKPILDDIDGMEKESTVIVTTDRVAHDLSFSCEISMVDGKMVDLIQGDSGSFCHYCDVSKLTANNLESIQLGFPITKTYEQVKERWEMLSAGNMAYSDPARKGQCHEPMVKKDLRYFACLHSKLRSLDFCLKLLYHIESGQTHTWSESNANVLQAVNLAKKEVREKISQQCGLVLDMPTSNGGNTNNGPTADRLLMWLTASPSAVSFCIRRTEITSLFSSVFSIRFSKLHSAATVT